MPTNTWTPTSGTLWTTILNWSQGRIPITGDSVVIAGSSSLPTSGPAISVSLAGFDTSGITANWNNTGSYTLTNNVVMAASGILNMGNPKSASHHVGWSGDAHTNSGITATLFNCKVLASASFAGCTGGLTLNGDTVLLGATSPSPTFLGSSGQSCGTITGIITANTNGTVDNGVGGGSGGLTVSGVTLVKMLKAFNWDDSTGTTTWGGPISILDYSYLLGPVTPSQLAGGTQWYVSTSGSNANTGLSPAQAFADPVFCASQMHSFDTMNVGAGAWAFGSSALILPQYCQIIGAGIDVTTFTATTNGNLHAAVVGVVGCRYYNFTADTTAAVPTNTVFPFGCSNSDAAAYGIYVQNVKMHGSIDGFFSGTQPCSGTLVNCWFGSTFDCVAFSGSNLVLINPTIVSTGPNASGTNICRGINGNGSMTVIGGTVTVTNGNGDTSGVETTGVTTLIGVTISATAGSGTVYSLNNTGTMSTYNCALTGATNGTITALTQAQAIAAESPPGALFTYTGGGTATGSFAVGAVYPSVLDVRSGAGVGAGVGGLITQDSAGGGGVGGSTYLQIGIG